MDPKLALQKRGVGLTLLSPGTKLCLRDVEVETHACHLQTRAHACSLVHSCSLCWHSSSGARTVALSPHGDLQMASLHARALWWSPRGIGAGETLLAGSVLPAGANGAHAAAAPRGRARRRGRRGASPIRPRWAAVSLRSLSAGFTVGGEPCRRRRSADVRAWACGLREAAEASVHAIEQRCVRDRHPAEEHAPGLWAGCSAYFCTCLHTLRLPLGVHRSCVVPPQSHPHTASTRGSSERS